MLTRLKTLSLAALLLNLPLLLTSSLPASAQAPAYDLVLRNARIVDGSGRAAYPGDVAIRGDTIVQVARAITEPSKRVIDVGGQVLAPGFIDVHSHGRYGIVTLPSADNVVRQGVTTIIEGPDGNSPVPLAPFLNGSRLYTRPSISGRSSGKDQFATPPWAATTARLRPPNSTRCARWSSKA